MPPSDRDTPRHATVLPLQSRRAQGACCSSASPADFLQRPSGGERRHHLKAADLTLTPALRGRSPWPGCPLHQLDTVRRLASTRTHRVAVVDQIRPAAAQIAGAGMHHRTRRHPRPHPGTLIDESLLQPEAGHARRCGFPDGGERFDSSPTPRSSTHSPPGDSCWSMRASPGSMNCSGSVGELLFTAGPDGRHCRATGLSAEHLRHALPRGTSAGSPRNRP